MEFMQADKSTMHIAIATNCKFMKYAYVMLTSLLENNRNRNVCIYILYQEKEVGASPLFEKLEEKYKARIIPLLIRNDFFPENMVYTDYWPMEIWYRIALPLLLPEEVNRILYLDVDVAVCAPLDELYDVELGNNILAAGADYVMPREISEKQALLFQECLEDADFKYFNSGVLLMNIDKMRKEDFFHRIVDCAMEKCELLVAPDQDVLNYLYRKETLFFDREKYNFFARLEYKEGKGYAWAVANTAIVHFAGHKPWDNKALHFETERIWWEYAKKTDIYTELLEELVYEMVDSNFWFSHVNKLYDDQNLLLQDNEELRQVVSKFQIILQNLGLK